MTTAGQERPDHHVLVDEGTDSEHPLLDAPGKDFGRQPIVTTSRGLTMPRAGFGTYELVGGEATSMVEAALELGIRHIDTAQSYGNERAVGKAIGSSAVDRADVFLTTKIDNDNHRPADLITSVEQSLERLQTSHLDLLLVHWPVEWDIIAATLDTLAQVQASGLTNHIGVSNFTVDQLDEVKSFAPLEVLQVECHPFLQQRELRAWCEDNDWIFTAYSPLAQGAVSDDRRLREIADDHETTAAAVSLAWLYHQANVVAIPRTRDPEHLADNWDARNLSLTQSDLSALAELDAGRRLVDPEDAPW